MSNFERICNARTELMKSQDRKKVPRLEILSQLMKIIFLSADKLPKQFELKTLSLDAEEISFLLESVFELKFNVEKQVDLRPFEIAFKVYLI